VYFAPQPTAGALQAILDDAVAVADVALENPPRADSGGGMLSYLHKVKAGAHIDHFANSSNDRVDAWVRLRGKLTLQAWDPHSGAEMTDVPSHSWVMPTLLAHAGVRFLQLGGNGTSAFVRVPRLFWWEGPDSSRILYNTTRDSPAPPLPVSDWQNHPL